MFRSQRTVRQWIKIYFCTYYSDIYKKKEVKYYHRRKRARLSLSTQALIAHTHIALARRAELKSILWFIYIITCYYLHSLEFSFDFLSKYLCMNWRIIVLGKWILTDYFTNQTIPKSIQMGSKKKLYKKSISKRGFDYKMNNWKGGETMYTLHTSETKRQKRAHTKQNRLAVRKRAKSFEKS